MDRIVDIISIDRIDIFEHNKDYVMLEDCGNFERKLKGIGVFLSRDNIGKVENIILDTMEQYDPSGAMSKEEINRICGNDKSLIKILRNNGVIEFLEAKGFIESNDYDDLLDQIDDLKNDDRELYEHIFTAITLLEHSPEDILHSIEEAHRDEDRRMYEEIPNNDIVTDDFDNEGYHEFNVSDDNDRFEESHIHDVEEVHTINNFEDDEEDEDDEIDYISGDNLEDVTRAVNNSWNESQRNLEDLHTIPAENNAGNDLVRTHNFMGYKESNHIHSKKDITPEEIFSRNDITDAIEVSEVLGFTDICTAIKGLLPLYDSGEISTVSKILSDLITIMKDRGVVVNG